MTKDSSGPFTVMLVPLSFGFREVREGLVSQSAPKEVPKIADTEPEGFDEFGGPSEFSENDFRKNKIKDVPRGDDPTRIVYLEEVSREYEDMEVTAANAPDFHVTAKRTTSVTFKRQGEPLYHGHDELGFPVLYQRHYVWSQDNPNDNSLSMFERSKEVTFPVNAFSILGIVFENMRNLAVDLVVSSPTGTNIGTLPGMIDRYGEDMKQKAFHFLGSGTIKNTEPGDPTPETPYPFTFFDWVMPFGSVFIHHTGGLTQQGGALAFHLLPDDPRIDLPNQFETWNRPLINVARDVYKINHLGSDGEVLDNGSQWRIAVGPHFHAGPLHNPGADGNPIQSWSTTSGHFTVDHDYVATIEDDNELTHGHDDYYFYMLWSPERPAEDEVPGQWVSWFINWSAIFKIALAGGFTDGTQVSVDIMLSGGEDADSEHATPTGKAVVTVHKSELAMQLLEGFPPEIDEETDPDDVLDQITYAVDQLTKQTFTLSRSTAHSSSPTKAKELRFIHGDVQVH